MNLEKKAAFGESYEPIVLHHYQWSPYKSTIIWKGITAGGGVSGESKNGPGTDVGGFSQHATQPEIVTGRMHHVTLFKQWPVEKTT